MGYPRSRRNPWGPSADVVRTLSLYTYVYIYIHVYEIIVILWAKNSLGLDLFLGDLHR